MTRKAYPSDVSDDEWAFVAPYLTLMKEDAPQREPDLREVFNDPLGLQHFTAVAASLVGVGLILPWLTGILPWLTPLAAVGLVLIMIGTIIFHIPRKEYPNIVFNLVLLALAAFVAYERFVFLTRL